MLLRPLEVSRTSALTVRTPAHLRFGQCHVSLCGTHASLSMGWAQVHCLFSVLRSTSIVLQVKRGRGSVGVIGCAIWGQPHSLREMRVSTAEVPGRRQSNPCDAKRPSGTLLSSSRRLSP